MQKLLEGIRVIKGKLLEAFIVVQSFVLRFPFLFSINFCFSHLFKIFKLSQNAFVKFSRK